MSTPKPTAYTPIRYLWLLTGCISFILGTAGIVLPVLPTVPFICLPYFVSVAAPRNSMPDFAARSYIGAMSSPL